MTDDSKKKVLVVDDEGVIREFLNEVLEEDFTVTLACDGDEAIAQIQKQHFDLVITDLKMPRVSGEEVVRFTHNHDATIKIIVISGYSSLYTVSQTVHNGACAFLSKPFSISQLMQAVESCLVR
jgi:DNA-binding NtrC family response regulator